MFLYNPLFYSYIYISKIHISFHLYIYLSINQSRKYKCVAENILGTAEHHLELEEAREPGVIHEVTLLIDVWAMKILRSITLRYFRCYAFDQNYQRNHNFERINFG